MGRPKAKINLTLSMVEEAFANGRVTLSMLADAAAEANFISDLVQWADNIRKTYMAGGMSEIVTTRRLESILKAFSIFGKHTTAIEMGISRFDEQTKSDMIRLYEKISGERTESNTQESEATDANDNPNAVPWN